jgi:hypothetical protein
VKREMPAWISRLQNDGFGVHRFSMAEQIADILQTPSKLRTLWLAADRRAPLAWEKTNQAMANVLTSGVLLERLKASLEVLRERPNAILLDHGPGSAAPLSAHRLAGKPARRQLLRTTTIIFLSRQTDRQDAAEIPGVLPRGRQLSVRTCRRMNCELRGREVKTLGWTTCTRRER